jgi:hypothetical protein
MNNNLPYIGTAAKNALASIKPATIRTPFSQITPYCGKKIKENFQR